MPWYYNIVPESIKKNVCIYLLQRYMGQFFEEKINRDQLNIDFYNGTGTVEKINLDVQALNHLSEDQNWPMEFVDGYIDKIYLKVPWSTILKDSCYVEVTGLRLTLQPQQRQESATSMFESMWNSMTSSMQLAEECAKQEAEMAPTDAQPYEGLELFAQTIDSILNRVQVKFIDTEIQIEHVPKDSSTGVGIIINIEDIEYLDESGNDPTPDEATDLTSQDSKKGYIVQSFTTKKFVIRGVTLSTVEFSSKARTFSRSVLVVQSHHSDSQKDDSVITVLEKGDFDIGEDFGNNTNDSTNKGTAKEEESSPSNQLENDRHVILFAKLSSMQEIRLRLKQSENLAGPKVFIEANLGALVTFLSPRQLHVLIELAKGLAKPEIEDTSNVAPKTRCVSRPMTSIDYQRVEQDLQNQLQSLRLGGVQTGRGWSSAGVGDSDTDEIFYPMPNTSGGMCDSTFSGISSSMESSTTSSIASSFTEQSHRSRRRVHNIETDPTAEISHFQIRFASLTIVLLHEDLLVKPSDSEYILAPSSVQQMQQHAKHFFEVIGDVVMTTYGVYGDFTYTRTVFEKACKLSHLRLIAAPVQIDGNEKTTLSSFSIAAQVTSASLILIESLYGAPNNKPGYFPILVFDQPASVKSSPITAKPSFKLNFKHIEKTGKKHCRSGGPKTDISICLGNCWVDLDITIVDRLTALLNPPTICVIEKRQFNPWTTCTQYSETDVTTESKVDLKISSPDLNIKLRFPIPDFRPPHDMNRIPWWMRHLRPDYLSLVLHEALLHSTFQSSQTFQEYNIESRGLDVIYYETQASIGIAIGKAGFDEKYSSSMQDVLLQSRLSIKVYPTKEDDSEPITIPKLDPMTTSCYGAFIDQRNEEPSPFSAKKVVHESDTCHTQNKDDAEELLLPGDKEEINKFIKYTKANCKIQVEVFLPMLSVQLHSKHIYEVLYNRINNDLLLWEPSAPKPKTNLYEVPAYNYTGPSEVPDVFKLCKSAMQYESESESEEDEDDMSNIFYSTCDSRMKFSTKSQAPEAEAKHKGQSYLALNIQIGQGLACLIPPFRDVTTNNVIPGLEGEFLFNLEDANIFIVNGYDGDKNLGYVCVQIHNSQLHHCDMIKVPSVRHPLKEVGTAPGRHLHTTIHKSESGILATAKNRGGNREMITVAIKIQANHETHNVKTVQVAAGINKATLRHRMCKEPNTWISQLLDFFNSQDYPIPGYVAKDVLVELHLHLWDCSIDYRPRHLPIRCAITVGTFSMSSHLSAQANTSTLRFIFEECGLFLSEKAPPRHGLPSTSPVDLKRDYVNVVHVGLFELSLKTTDKKCGINPHIDLRASNDMLDIYTCADSARALMQLITYFAENGDIPRVSPERSPYTSPKHHGDQQLVNVEPENANTVTEKEQIYINAMLADAMGESGSEEGEPEPLQEVGAQVFFFPDEHRPLRDLPPSTVPPFILKTDLGNAPYQVCRPSKSEDENGFYIIDSDDMGTFPKGNQPKIIWLIQEPIQIKENFISKPIGRTDILKKPDYFPTPTMRYTLCEMTIVWHMYGGNDFNLQDKENKKKTVNFSDQKYDTIGFSNSASGSVNITSSTDRKLANMPWTQRGGANRNHKVLMELQLNKVRFVHETYPDHTIEASRQVLVINEVEIRDRLECSQINKFLYEYISQSRPKQTNSNMVVIKTVHIRPDLKLRTEECILRMSVLPLRLNIDQDALLFLISYFQELAGCKSLREENQSKHGTPTHQPVLSMGEVNEDFIKEHAKKTVNDNLMILIEENKAQQQADQDFYNSSSSVPDDSPVYFRSIMFTPDVPIRLDYHGKRLDMTHGPIPGLLMGLGQLNCSELKLKTVTYRHGLLGVEKLMSYLLQEWLNDIKKNQLPSLLGGFGPMHSLVQLFQGVRDLFWLPIEQYQKDGRIVRGLQRGANSFTTSTAMAALELTSRLIHLIQITAETAYDMLSPGPSVKRIRKSKGRRRRYLQPQDIREGVTNAYNVVKEGIGETSENIVQVVSREKEQKGYSGMVGGVLRTIPPTILKPVIIASEATSNVLGGMKSQLVPDARREANQKWRCDDYDDE